MLTISHDCDFIRLGRGLLKIIIPMDKNEDFQHLEEMIANLQAKQKQILKGMLDYPIEIDSAIRILS